ncbi:MAG: MarR family transcriptional regulator [Sphaerochaeta sp.]
MDDTHRIGLTIKTLSHLLSRAMGKQLRDEQHSAATAVRSHILGYFAHHRVEEVQQAVLQQHLGIRRSTMTNILSGMESEGLVSRVEDTQDKRQKRVVLTDTAKNLCNEHLALVNAFEKKLERALTDEELSQFFAIAEKLKTTLETC